MRGELSYCCPTIIRQVIGPREPAPPLAVRQKIVGSCAQGPPWTSVLVNRCQKPVGTENTSADENGSLSPDRTINDFYDDKLDVREAFFKAWGTPKIIPEAVILCNVDLTIMSVQSTFTLFGGI
jgi:hypothetical protein